MADLLHRPGTPSDPASGGTAEAAAPLDRSRTPLLALITADALDRDYLSAAARRGAGAAPRRSSARLRVAVVGVVGIFALLVTIAAAQTSRNADVDTASRADLVERINIRRDRVAVLQRDIARLRASNTAADRYLAALSDDYSAAQGRLASVGAVTGFEPVTGDGIRVVVDNAPDAGGNETLRDSDLALLSDALWSAGAEAIAINGQRVTAVTGIRTSGDAIEVNGVGVAPPYTLLAIGDQRTLAADLAESGAGLQFLALARQYGFRYDVADDDDIRLAAAPASARQIRYAQRNPTPKTAGGGAP
ncbi:DUF881 domain-containing protein [Nocardioides sp.]|uniref:DUF881 domain-containing protein n=1 Tax=Nocardioides sp. TaxID=35761 RepID=UPI00351908CC